MAAMSTSSVHTWRNLFLVFRFTIYALFVICNAIICCAAVWNLSFGLAGTPSHLDAYLIFTGAFSLIFVFPVIFIDVFRRHALTSRVWFEIAWTGIFWILELAAASAISVQGSADPCDIGGASGNLAIFLGVKSSCRSTNVLLAFTWIIATLLLCYFAVLLLLAVYHHDRFSEVWHSGVSDFPWFAQPDNSPMVKRYTSSLDEQKITPYTMRLPQPRRLSSLRNAVHSWRQRVNPADRPESVFTQAHSVYERDLPPPPALAAVPERTRSPPALYAEQVQLALRAIVWDTPADRQPAAPGVAPLRIRTGLAPAAPPPALFRSPSSAHGVSPYNAYASPLGDWPNAQVMQQPLSQKRRKPPPPPSSFPIYPAAAQQQQEPPSPLGSLASLRPMGRPTGPRGRTSSMSSENGP